MAIYNGGLNIKQITRTSELTNDSGFLTNGDDGVVEVGEYLDFHMNGKTEDYNFRMHNYNHNWMEFVNAGLKLTQLNVTNSGYPYGKVNIAVDGESGYIELSNQDLNTAGNTAHLDLYKNTFRVVKINSDGKVYVPLQVENGQVICNKVYGAVWNDLSDSIPVDDDCNLEHGYCYCFNGKKYTKSSKYLDDGIIGIHSDTYGFKMGSEEGKKKMDVAVSGFVLAYVDKEYKPGTPLTCTENGYLTEIKKEDKIEYPEKIVATYWKNEPAEEWGSEDRKVKVNGRKWVKIK